MMLFGEFWLMNGVGGMSTLVALKRGMFLTNGNFGGRHRKEKENKKYLMIPYY